MKTPAQWRKDIERSQKYQKCRRDEAARFQRAYTGDYNKSPRKALDENKDEMNVNFVYSYVETIGPTIFSGEPKIIADPRNMESQAAAKNLEAVVNYWAFELGTREDFMLCRWDRFFGNTYFLSEWEYEDEEEEIPEISQVDPMTGLPVLIPGRTETRVIKDQPILKRLDPADVLIDPDSKCRKEDRWRAYKMILSFAQYKKLYPKDRKRKDNGQYDVEPEAMPLDATRLESDTEQGVDKEWVILWKIYDLENEKIIVLRDKCDSGEFEEETPWPFEMEVQGDRFPITVLEAKHDAASPYSFSEFKAFWPQIQERNKIRTTIQSATRRQHPKYLNKTSANDEDQLNKFTNAKIGEVVTMNNPEALMLAPMHVIPADTYNFDKISGDDLVNISGFYEYNNDSIADTATEASLLSARGNIRKDEQKQAFELFVTKALAKCGQLCQQFMDAPAAIQIQNPKNPKAMEWLNVSKEQIQGEFGWRMRPGVMQHKDEGLRRQQTLKFAEIMGSNPYVDQAELATQLAEEFEKDASRLIRSAEVVQQERDAAAQANAKPAEPPKPTITFSDIKWETLPSEIQAMVLQEAFKQNGVGPEDGGGAPSGGASAASMPPPNQSMAQGEIGTQGLNQAPIPLPGGMEPPANPISPMSLAQGGSQGA